MADAIVKKLLKYSYQASLSDMKGFGNVLQAKVTLEVFNQVFAQCPACKDLYYPNTKQPIVTPNFYDCVYQKTQSGQSAEEASIGCRNILQLPQGILEDDPNLLAKIDACAECMSQRTAPTANEQPTGQPINAAQPVQNQSTPQSRVTPLINQT